MRYGSVCSGIEAVDRILAEEKAIEILSDMNLAARREGEG